MNTFIYPPVSLEIRKVVFFGAPFLDHGLLYCIFIYWFCSTIPLITIIISPFFDEVDFLFFFNKRQRVLLFIKVIPSLGPWIYIFLYGPSMWFPFIYSPICLLLRLQYYFVINKIHLYVVSDPRAGPIFQGPAWWSMGSFSLTHQI